MNDTSPGASATLDLRGYRCPIPVALLQAALRGLPAGSQVTVFADDPLAAMDIPEFCRSAGHVATRLGKAPKDCVFLVTRGPEPA